MNADEIAPRIFLILVLLIAMINDVRFRKIPNWLTLSAVILSMGYHTSTKGLSGFVFSAQGVGVGMAALAIPYLMGGTGAGDVKLMGGIGSLLGPKGAFIATIFIFLMGGIYAIVLLIVHRYFKEAMKRYWSILKTFLLTRKIVYLPPSENEEKPKLCYAVPIALGTFISLFLK